MTPRRAVDCPDSRVVEPAVARSREGKNGLRLWLSQPFTKRLLGLVAFGVVLRLAAVYDVRTQPVSDFWSYYQRALNLYDQWCYDVFPGVPDASYPPAYPILLAAAFVLVPTSHTLALAKLVNCLLGGLTIFIGGQLARRFWGHRAGLLAALLAAIYPRYLLMPCILASENLFAPLLLLFIYLSLQACRRSRSPRAAVLGGAALGLLALTRTVAYYFGCLWLLGAIASRKRWRVILLEMTLLLGVQHAVMLPWAIRNSVAIGRFTFLTTTGGINLFIGNNPHASGGWYDWGADLERVAPGILRKGSVAIDDAARAAALAWMRDHPAQATLLYFKKLHMIVMDDAIIAGWAISGQRITPPPEGRDVLPGPHFLKRASFRRAPHASDLRLDADAARRRGCCHALSESAPVALRYRMDLRHHVLCGSRVCARFVCSDFGQWSVPMAPGGCLRATGWPPPRLGGELGRSGTINTISGGVSLSL